ncbi:MAG: hypothetical protein ACOYIK_00970 [Coriobacteriales bacterium]|jgi:hypothetical protein
MRTDDGGQMAVELVVLIPVVLVVAAIAFSMLWYLGDCARFDRVSSEAVRVYGVSPSYGEYGSSSCCSKIQSMIEDSFGGRDDVMVTVTSIDIGMVGGGEIPGNGLVFSMIPSLRRYTCKVSVSPSFFPREVFGISLPTLEHERNYVVDPYEPGGWS